MNLPFKIARRYLFGKKSTNAINIISGISAIGITVGTASLIVILSVFNGFESLLTGLFSSFNPDIKITAVAGKVFSRDSIPFEDIIQLPGVEAVSGTLEETALFELDGLQALGIIKGVDENFTRIAPIDSIVKRGQYQLKDKDLNTAIFGSGMERKLALSFTDDRREAINIYMAKRKSRGGSLSKPFKNRKIYPAGAFELLQDFEEYVITNLEFAQQLLDYNSEISALEVRLSKNKNPDKTQAAIEKLIGPEFAVKNRYQQDEAFYKITNLEKWVAFLLFSFALALVAFNMVGALSMLVMEKKKDIAMLKSMGAQDRTIKQIFITEGFLLGLLGTLVGFVVAIILVFLQQKFGLIQLEGSGTFVIDAYPVKLNLWDFVMVFFTVVIICVLASWLPASKAAKMSSLIQEE